MNVKHRSGRYVKFFIYLVTIVLINVVGISLFFRVDLTKNKIYSISDASKMVVSTLSEPLTINVFFTKNLPAPHNNTEQYLHDLLEEYSAYGNQYFNYRFFDVSADENDIDKETAKNQDLAKNYGIYPLQIRIIKGDEVKFQRAYMGLVLIHGDIIERIPNITSTDRLEYKITTAIKKLNNKVSAFLNLKDTIQIKLIYSSSLNAVSKLMALQDLPELPSKLQAIVEKLNDKFYGKIEFEYHDPSKGKDMEAIAKKYEIMELKWPSLSNGKIQPGKGSIGLVMEHKEKVIKIPLIHVFRLPLVGTHYELVNMEKIEGIINDNLESLINIHEELGYLAGNGTLNIFGSSQHGSMMTRQQGDISSFYSLASKGYTIKTIDLKDDIIPSSLTCLIIARPTENFTDYELFQIDQFLMKGKNLAIFLDAFNENRSPNQPNAFTPLNTGLEKLLEHYGITIKESLVMDMNCYKQSVPQNFGGGERPIYFAPLIKNKFINNELGFMRNIKGLIAMKISPLELRRDRLKENNITAHQLFSSSEDAWEMSGQINLNPMFIRPPSKDEGKQSFPLAYIAEGKFPSYFEGKGMPEKKPSEAAPKEEEQTTAPDKKTTSEVTKIEGSDTILSKAHTGKIFIVASSEMIQNNLLDEEGAGPNAIFIMNVLDYLNNKEEIAVMRSKEQRFNPLYEIGAVTRNFIKYFNIAGLPALVVLSGFFVWLHRRNRKRRIQMIFQQ
jgi:ABC-2 type transport system permease protein